MRKVEQKLIAAIHAALKGEKIAQPGGNTTVERCEGAEYIQTIVRVRLHGNVIAELFPKKGGVEAAYCSLAGWNTPTTRSRINAICREFGHKYAKVYTYDFNPYGCYADGAKRSLPAFDFFRIDE